MAANRSSSCASKLATLPSGNRNRVMQSRGTESRRRAFVCSFSRWTGNPAYQPYAFSPSVTAATRTSTPERSLSRNQDLPPLAFRHRDEVPRSGSEDWADSKPVSQRERVSHSVSGTRRSSHASNTLALTSLDQYVAAFDLHVETRLIVRRGTIFHASVFQAKTRSVPRADNRVALPLCLPKRSPI